MSEPEIERVSQRWSVVEESKTSEAREAHTLKGGATLTDRALYGLRAISSYFGVHRNTILRWANHYGFPLRRNPRPFLLLSDLDGWGRPGEKLKRRSAK